MRSTPRLLLLVLALVSTPLAGCADDGGAGSASATELDAGPGQTPDSRVTLEYKDASLTVSLVGLPRRDYKGSEVVSLSLVWERSGVSAAVEALEFDFEGDDGFRPTSRDRCKAKLAGSALPLGYVLPETRTLVWDESLGLPGCYGVKGVAKIIATDKP